MKKFIFCIIILSKLIFGRDISFSGKSSLESFFTDNANYGYRNDTQYLRWKFFGNLDVYKLPFRLNFYLTTEKYRSNQNQYGISLNIYKLRQQIPWLESINNLSLGTVAPKYSILTLNRMRLTGINFKWNPGIMHFAVAAGKMNTVNFRLMKNNDELNRIIQHYQIGLGQTKSNNLHFSFMHVRDFGDSATVAKQENIILAEHAQLFLFDKIVRLKAESAVSMHTRDLSSSKIDAEDIPKGLPAFITPRLSTSLDWAANFETDIKFKDTHLQGRLKRLGPGYISLGNPMLFRDRMEYKGKLKQRFFHRRAYISTFYRHSYDNLIPWKSADTKITSWGVRTGGMIAGKTNLMVSYSPHMITRKYDETTSNKTEIISCLVGHSYKINTFSNTTRLFAAYQKATSDFQYSNFTSQTTSLNHSIKLISSLSFSTSISYNTLERDDKIYKRWSNTFYCSYLYKGKYQQRAGWEYKDHDKNGRKIGFFVEIRWQIWKLGNMALKIERNYFRDQIFFITNDFNQFKILFKLEKKI